MQFPLCSPTKMRLQSMSATDSLPIIKKRSSMPKIDARGITGVSSRPKLFANCRVETLLQLGNDSIVGRIDFIVGQRALRVSIMERVGNALLAFGNVFAAEHVEEFDAFEILRLELFD